MPILRGIIASSISNSALAGNFTSIATITAAGGEASLTFSSIPQTYKALQIRGIAKDNTTTVGDDGFVLRFNGDSTSANYNYQYLFGNGSTVTAGGSSSSGGIPSSFGELTSSTGTTSMFGVSVIDVIDYTSTSKYKIAKLVSGGDENVSSTNFALALSAGFWLQLTAINSVTISAGGGTFVANTQFALYGIS